MFDILHSNQGTSFETTSHPQTAGGTLADKMMRAEEARMWVV